MRNAVIPEAAAPMSPAAKKRRSRDLEEKRARRLLKKSIRHWKSNALSEVPSEASIAAEDCALCHGYCLGAKCDGCPVKIFTGRHLCDGSPYTGARAAFTNWEAHPTNPAYHKIFKRAARTEVAFLQMLLAEFY